MAWWLHLSTQPISAVQLIGGEPPQVAVWDSRRNVHFFEQRSGTPSGERQFEGQPPPDDLSDGLWREFVAALQAPNGSYLPTVILGRMTLYQSRDGRMRLYHFPDSLILEVDGRHIALDREQDGRFLVAGLDRALGLIGAVNDAGLLYVFQQHVRVGTFDLGLVLGVDARLSLLAPDATGSLLVSDGERVVLVDSGGHVQHQLVTHYAAGPLAVSPDGQVVALADIDDNVIRIYDGTLSPTHQKHAIDLVLEARQVQLMASLPGRRVALAAVDVSTDGTLAFALGGVVCITSVHALDVLPQPRPLL